MHCWASEKYSGIWKENEEGGTTGRLEGSMVITKRATLNQGGARGP